MNSTFIELADESFGPTRHASLSIGGQVVVFSVALGTLDASGDVTLAKAGGFAALLWLCVVAERMPWPFLFSLGDGGDSSVSWFAKSFAQHASHSAMLVTAKRECLYPKAARSCR